MMKKDKVSRRSVRIISDKLFEELWIKANNINTKEEYLKEILDINSKYKNIYLQNKITLNNYIDMLEYIYDLSKYSFKDIVIASGLKSSKFRHYYCIPENTYKAWYYGKNPCPSYYRLLILKNTGKFKLPHHIYLESEEPEEKRKNIIKTEKELKELNEVEVKEFNYTKEEYDTIKEWEREHLKENTEAKELINKLKYLDKLKN